MAISLDTCYANHIGQVLDIDGYPADAGQCVQWADTVINEVYGFGYIYANAIDWWTNPQVLAHFTQITDGSLQKGDFVVFNKSVGSVYGHIDVAMDNGTIDNFTGADSNWSGNKTVHLVNHVGRQYVIGSLRLKGGTMDKITQDEENACAIMATGSYPGKDYNYQFTGLPLTQDNLDKMLQFWQGQMSTPTVAGFTPYIGQQLYLKEG